MTLVTPLILPTIVLFVLVHILGGKLTFLGGVPRSIWLSGAGGISVAYVYLLPELARHQESFGRRARDAQLFGSLESHAYLIALGGLTLFYGMDRLARSASVGRIREPMSLPIFWVRLSSFAIYNILIGYLLVNREEHDLRGLVIYAIVMGLHFVVNDQALREQHADIYDRYSRWLLAIAPVAGLALGLSVEVSRLLLSALFAFLAGGIILNVLKEELPEQRQSRFSAFAGGAAFYAMLLLWTV